MRTEVPRNSNRVMLAHISHLPLGRWLTHALNARMLKSVIPQFQRSSSCHRPPQNQPATSIEDRHCRPANPCKGFVAWSLLLITKAYEEWLAVIGNGDPYAFQFFQFREIGLKLFGHSQQIKAIRMPNSQTRKSGKMRGVKNRPEQCPSKVSSSVWTAISLNSKEDQDGDFDSQFKKGAMRWRRAPFLNLLMPVLRLPLIWRGQVMRAIEVMFPELSVVLYPVGNLMQRSCFEPAWPPLSIASSNDQPCVLQHFDMFADGRHAHVERPSQFSHRCFSSSQSRQDRPPGWIC